ncbi:right-handed parallel beta-helix repeat-containing protein [bacterium]|nr:right-handed parallel beta-helix repeat-containing protein [bacterium]
MVDQKLVFFFLILVLFASVLPVAESACYYVSMNDGDDGYDGLSPDFPFQTIDRVNQLDLSPGDQVLFKCGDIWRTEMLLITSSGSPTQPILFGSYPSLTCSDKPIISGSQPISGWGLETGNIYRANLSTGANAGLFPNGINQLFRNGARLPLGRWPNLASHPDGGYSTVDAHNSSLARITDNELPALDWTGAAIHMKGIRWYIMNREVVGSGIHILTLNEDVTCYTGNCTGWGYFINSHHSTLDCEGEWYYDEASHYVYVYTTTGKPANGELEGSAILTGQGDFLGGIILGTHLYEHITDVIIDNFVIRNWFMNGITTPTNYELDDPERLTIRNNIIRDVDEEGINLQAWVWNAGSNSGWRGGEYLTIQNNVIDGANHYGIDSYASSSLFEGNVIRNIGLIENLGRSGLGCGFTGNNCTENGAGFRIKLDKPAFSAHDNIIRLNTIERVGMQGIDVFGPNNIIEHNFIKEACFSKGDCGGVRTFGGSSFLNTSAVNITLAGNIIVDTIGNTDGCHSDYDALFGFGLYIDHYSDAIIMTDNTVLNSTVAGILVQDSRATITGSVLHNNQSGTLHSGQISLTGSQTRVTLLNNVLYGITPEQYTLRVESLSNLLGSDYNYYFNPYFSQNMLFNGTWPGYTFEEWQAFSGLDLHSQKNWFTLNPGEPPLSTVFYNATTQQNSIDLGAYVYLDLDQNQVSNELLLGPYESEVLIKTDLVVPEVDPALFLIIFTAIFWAVLSRKPKPVAANKG